MQRLIYDSINKKIILIIDNCEGTITGTPYDIFEGSSLEVQAEIQKLGLSSNTN